MIARHGRPLILVAACAVTPLGCGAAKLRLDAVPLPSGARVVAQSYECEAPEECFRYAIVAGPRDVSAKDLAGREAAALDAHGWRAAESAAPGEAAATSPDGKLFVAWATGARERRAVRAGSIAWSERLASRLGALVDAGTPVLALTLEPHAD